MPQYVAASARRHKAPRGIAFGKQSTAKARLAIIHPDTVRSVAPVKIRPGRFA